jgi:N-acetyl-anhydromuramyl-L-alanine amidase AmpD
VGEPQVIQHPVANYGWRAPGATINGVVIHCTTGGPDWTSTLKAVFNWFDNPASSASAHCVIDRNGDIYETVPDEATAWHAGIVDKPLPAWIPSGSNPNSWTLGLELLGNPGDYTEAQYDSAAWWIRQNADEWGFPATNIIEHRHLYSQRADPGPVAMSEIRRRL